MPSSGRAPPANLDVERLSAFYRQMLRIRAFEETAIHALGEGLVYGAIHPSIGQEAIAVGVCEALRADDIILSTHRGHGQALVKGASPEAMMSELFGRKNGSCMGKGGSMHIADFSVGMLGANGVVAANINIAAGAAHAIKLKGQDKVVVCFFGDGAINRGPFLEGLNWAGVFKLPIMFVCEDNGFAASTRTSAMTSGDGAAARARAIGIEALDVDGNDVVALNEASRERIELARGGVPQMLVARTYRLTGHTAVDPAHYRPESEVEEKWRDDPIARCRSLLEVAGIGSASLAAIAGQAEAEIAAAYEAAKASPWPEPDLAFADVQDIGDPASRPYS